MYKYPGLITKGKSFYFRLGIPRPYWEIARCKDIGFSLNTSDFQTALKRWKTEFTHIQQFLNVFEEITMKLTPDKKLILNEPDMDKILLFRLGQIQHFIEENVNEIEDGKKKFKDIRLYNPNDKQNKPDKIKRLMIEYILNYFKSLIDSSQANITLRTTYSKLKSKEIELGLAEKNETGDEWFKSFSTHMTSLDKYASYAVNAIKNDTVYNPSNPKVKTLLSTYDSFKSMERINHPITTTPWRTLCKRFVKMKRNLMGLPEHRLGSLEMYIHLCFLLMKREYVEDITKQDCRRLSEIIYRVPKRWGKLLDDKENISKILVDNRKRCLSKATIQNYLNTFKEFMRYAEKEEIIENNYNLFVDIPLKKDALVREPFTPQDLHTIFSSKTYPNPKLRTNAAKFFVPLIALFQGMRLNEICQLELSDIIVQKGVICFHVNHNNPNKSTKNEQSVRIVPIHPQLIDLGFLQYVKFQVQNKQKQLFSELKQHGHNGYGTRVQRWFARYLDEIGIPEESKVFHSFRHTFETKAVEVKIPPEYQNALCGWRDQGIGQRIYGKHKDINVMYSELAKINYPIRQELQILAEKLRDTYVFKLTQVKKEKR